MDGSCQTGIAMSRSIVSLIAFSFLHNFVEEPGRGTPLRSCCGGLPNRWGARGISISNLAGVSRDYGGRAEDLGWLSELAAVVAAKRDAVCWGEALGSGWKISAIRRSSIFQA